MERAVVANDDGDDVLPTDLATNSKRPRRELKPQGAKESPETFELRRREYYTFDTALLQEYDAEAAKKRAYAQRKHAQLMSLLSTGGMGDRATSRLLGMLLDN